MFDSTDAPSEAEITQFDGAVVVDQHIGRFEVSMDHFWAMQILQSTQEVVNNILDVKDFQVYATPEHLLQVTFGPFQNHVNRVEIFWVLRHDDLDELNHTWVL